MRDARRFQFQGHIKSIEEEYPVFCTIEFDRQDPSSPLAIELNLLGSEDQRKAASSDYLKRGLCNSFWINSEEPKMPSVEIRHMYQSTTGDSSISIEANRIAIGLTSDMKVQSGWFVKADLMPSGLFWRQARHPLLPNSEGVAGFAEDEKVEFTTSFGTAEITAIYDCSESKENGNNVLHFTDGFTITGNLNLESARDLHSLSAEIEEEFETTCKILSFCTRESVSFYEIGYVPQVKTWSVVIPARHLLRVRREIVTIRESDARLIHFEKLAKGGLNRILDSFKASANREKVSRVMDFLSSSYAIQSLPSAYLLAVAALELISSYENDNGYIIGSGKWQKIEKAMKGYLENLAVEHGLTDIVNDMKEKLPELRRSSSNSKIIAACIALGVKTDDIWPSEGFEEGLKSATKLRNLIAHAALCKDIPGLIRNLIRIRILVERLILKHLDWPDDQVIWWRANQPLIWANHRD